jgi:hypothetical protein
VSGRRCDPPASSEKGKVTRGSVNKLLLKENHLIELWLRKKSGRTRVLELPSDDRVPLVESKGKVSVRLNPLGIV